MTASRRTIIAFLMIGISVIGLAAGYASAAKAAKPSADFVKNATIGGQFEISSSRLALQNSQNNDVRNFAQHMIDDHTQIGDQLKSVVASSSESMQPSPSLDPAHQAMIDQLQDRKGQDFDRLYADDQLKAHKEAVRLFKNYANKGDNDALKSFAAQNLPTLQKHLADAVQLKKSL